MEVEMSQKSIQRIRVCLFTIGFFLFALLINSEVFANNLLGNPGFENGLNTWTIGGPNWQDETSVVYAGSHSAKNTIGTIPGNDYFASLSQEVSISAGQEVFATAQVKTNINPASPSVAGIKIEFLNGSGIVIGAYQDEIGGVENWRQLYVRGTAPVNTVEVRYLVFVYAAQGDTVSIGGLTYFDEAVLSTDYIQPPTSGLENLGFENGLHGWTQVGPNWTTETQVVYEGNYSARNTIGTIPGNDYFASISQTIDCSEDDYFYATLQVKTDINPLSSAVAGVIVEFLDGNGIPIAGLQVQDQIGGSTEWRQLYVSARSTAGVAQVRLTPFVWADEQDSLAIGGHVYFDNAVLTTNYIEPPDIFSLLNPKFENGLHDWNLMGPNWESQNSEVYSGDIAAKNTIGVIPNNDYFASISQTKNLSAGQKVRAGAKVKTDFHPDSSSAAGIVLEFIDSSEQLVVRRVEHDFSENRDATEWYQVFLEETAPPLADQVKFSIYVFANELDPWAIGGLAYFDDAALVIQSSGAVKTEGKQLLVDFDGNHVYEPYFIKAVGYSPYPIGRDPYDFGSNILNDQQILNRDFPLIEAMNANTIRIWEGNDIEQSGHRKTKITQATLDTAETHSIKVVAGFRVPMSITDFSDPAVRTDLISRFGDFVNDLKDHPAILMWNIGNENNYSLNPGNPEQIKAFYSLINEMAYRAREIEGRNYHPIAVANGDLLYIGEDDYDTTDEEMIELDVWGSNVYRNSTFGGLFSEFSQKSEKPFWISEFGTDAWHTLDIQTVPAGSYIVTVHAGSLMLSKRLIVLDK